METREALTRFVSFLNPKVLRKHWGLLIVLAIYMVISLTYGLLNPLGEAPDEPAHIALIRYIGQQRHLPRNADERIAAGYKSDWPMLYHILVGAATSWIDYDVLPHLKESYASPRTLLIYDGLPPFAVIHTADEAPPYRGVVLTWHLARLASTLLSAGTLVVIYLIVLTIRPGDRWLAWGATAITAAIPRFHFMASTVNDDNLLGLFCALFTLFMVKAWKNPKPSRPYLWLGLWLGLAVTTKYSVILLPFLVIAVLVRAIHKGKLNWPEAIGRLILFCITVTVTALWWFVYLERYFGKTKEQGIITGIINLFGADHITQRLTPPVSVGVKAPSIPSQSGATVWNWLVNLFRTFWFAPGQASSIVVAIISMAFLGLCLLSIGGLWQGWARRKDLPWSILGMLTLQIGLLLPLPLLRFFLTFNPAETGQGRHILFPAATAVGLLMTIGVGAWLPRNYRRFAGPALAAGLLAISLVTFFGFVLPAFPPRLPVHSGEDAIETVANRVDISLNASIELAGYEVGEVNKYGALPITLFWHSKDYVNQDYLVALCLTDDRGRKHSLSLTHPVDGRYPTRAWEPGEIIRDTLWLPLVGIEAGNYRLQLRLESPGTDLTLPNTTGITLTDITLPAITPPTTQSPFILWQSGRPASNRPVYEYRSAISITFLKSQNKVFLIDPKGGKKAPQVQVGDTFIFLVDAHWQSGEYSLQVETAGKIVKSEPVLRVKVRPRNFDLPAMSNEVRANFGNEVMLLGHDFPERKTEPGGALSITLYWQALQRPTHHYVVSNHLLNRADLQQWGGRDRVPQEFYSTFIWEPGEVVQDNYLVPVSPSAPDGVYQLDIGLYVEAAGQAHHLPLVSEGTVLEDNSVTIGPIKIGGPPPGVTVPNPTPQHPRAEGLGDVITLLGYDLIQKSDVLTLTLYWRCDAPPSTDYTTFVHVRDTRESIVAQMDRPPADGAYPTSLWDSGEVIRDSIQVPLLPKIPPGTYQVAVGLYDFQSGTRLPVADSEDNSIMLAEITK